MIKLEDTLPFKDSILDQFGRKESIKCNNPAYHTNLAKKARKLLGAKEMLLLVRGLPSKNSELLEKDVPVCMLQAMVPEEDPVPPRNLLGTLNDHLHYIDEMTTELEDEVLTYLFPVLTCLGLTSALLNAAKKSSQGAAS